MFSNSLVFLELMNIVLSHELFYIMISSIFFCIVFKLCFFILQTFPSLECFSISWKFLKSTMFYLDSMNFFQNFEWFFSNLWFFFLKFMFFFKFLNIFWSHLQIHELFSNSWSFGEYMDLLNSWFFYVHDLLLQSVNFFQKEYKYMFFL